MTEFATAYGKRKRVRFKCVGKSRTKKEFADECNVNNIVAKYQRTGAIEHFSRHAPRYDNVAGATFHQAMNIVTEASSMFEELPANLRQKFENDPAKFLDFVQDPENKAEMAELGLLAGPVEPVKLSPDGDAGEAGEPSLEGVSELPEDSEE